MSGRLAGRRVIVTGAARGIGATIAERFAQEGAKVAVLDRLEELGREVSGRTGGVFVPVDLADPQDTRHGIEAAIDSLDGVDILVNNAGILRFSALLDLSVDDWEEMFAINTTAMLVTTQVAVRAMIAAGRGGKIINMSSMAAKAGGAGQAHYAASKAAVSALTRCSALEFGEYGITANCLCPGYVLTEMGADTRKQEDIDTWSALSPLRRLAQPDDIAGVALFLASADGDYLTGQSINVTGGMIMH
ncbi:3-oxoacyl-[acyl-carrier protein] reductase [Nakamurella sp. UYEF19]|uniref:SDR family NAD(P)-dependent oxidoreductase n=1 Tax=Nakamurella sp. UYEF19 TaxID=1756392 RepID=UPI00339A1DF2